MNIDQQYPSKYLKADDVPKPIKLFIASVSIEEIEDGKTKPVLHFRRSENLSGHEEPAMVLNMTNANMIKSAYGSETDNWTDKEIGLWVDPNIQFGGKMVKGLRIKIFQAEPEFESVDTSAGPPDDSQIPW